MAIGIAVCATSKQRNFGVPLMVLVLGSGDASFLRADSNGDYTLGMYLFEATLLKKTLLTLLTAWQVLPYFAMRAVPG